MLSCVNKKEREFVQKGGESSSPLLDMLFREIIHHPHAHFTGFRRTEQLDGCAVKGRTQALLRVYTDTFLFRFFLHGHHPGIILSGFEEKIQQAAFGRPLLLEIQIHQIKINQFPVDFQKAMECADFFKSKPLI